MADKVERTLMLLGVRPGDLDYDAMLDAARRGWPAWRIAQAYGYSAALIYRLGGPPEIGHG